MEALKLRPLDKFDKDYERTRKFEGGDTVDHAGRTSRGIVQSTADGYFKKRGLPTKSVESLSDDEVKKIYKEDFYVAPGFDKLPDKVSGVVFDYGVNAGPVTATKALQRSVGAKADGVIGPKTLEAINSHIKKHGEKDILQKVIDDRSKYNKSLIENNPKTYKKYEDGWKDRINKIKSEFDLSALNPFSVKEASADEMKLDLRPISKNKLDLRPIENQYNFEEFDKTMLGQYVRKRALAVKTAGDIFAYPIGGTQGVYDAINKVIPPSPLDKKIEAYITNIRPESPVEHGVSAAIQFFGVGKLIGPISSVFGLGKPMSAAQTIMRNAGVGATIGALKPEETMEKRLENTLVSGAVGGVATGVLMGGQKILGDISRKTLANIAEKAGKAADAIETGLKTGGQVSSAKEMQTVLNELNPQERNFAMNVLRDKYGMSQKEYRNAYQKYIGDPLYTKVINFMDKHVPDSIKEKLVYRHDSPQFLTDVFEKHQNELNNWNKKAVEMGNLMTEGLSPAESTIIFRAISNPLQLDLLNATRPDLAKRGLEARNIIDSISQDYVQILKEKAKITDSKILREKYLGIAEEIKNNVGSYLQRTYTSKMPQGVPGMATRGTVTAKPMYERNKVAKEIYDKGLRDKIIAKTKEHNNLTIEKTIGGIGQVTKSKLTLRGIKTVEQMAQMKKQDLANILLSENKSRLDTKTRDLTVAMERLDDEIIGLNKLIEKQGVVSDLSNQQKNSRDVSKILGETSTGIRRGFEEDVRSRILKAEEFKEKLLSEWRGGTNPMYEDAIARAEEMINQAGRIAGQRRGLIGKINEYENLIVKPLKQPEIPYEIKKRLGFIDTGGVPVYKSIRDAGYRMESDRLFNSIAVDPRYATTNRMASNKGWVQIADSETKGSLRGMYVHPQVAKDINTIEKIFSEQDKTLNKLVSLWKVGKTALNPATHGRNVISNTMLLEASGVPSHRLPDLLAASADDITKNTPLYQELKKMGLGFSTFTESELAFINDVYKNNQGGLLEKVLGKVVSSSEGAFKPFKSLEKLYGLEEELFKIAKVRSLLEQGFTPKSAFKEAEKWLFNYNKITDFTRAVRTHPLGSPFITFQMKVIPRVLEATIKNPVDIVKYPLLFTAIEGYAKDKFNLSNSDMKLLKRNQPMNYVLPFTDSAGQLRMYNLKYTLPYGQMFEENPLATLGLGNNPIFSIPSSLWLNRNPLTGQDIYDRNSSKFRKFADGFDFSMKQILPTITPILGYSAQTIGKSINGIPLSKYGEKPDYWLELLGTLGGIKTKPTSVPLTYWKFMNEMKAIESDADRGKRSILRDQSLTPKQQQAELEDLMEEYLDNVNQRIDLFKEEQTGVLK